MAKPYEVRYKVDQGKPTLEIVLPDETLNKIGDFTNPTTRKPFDNSTTLGEIAKQLPGIISKLRKSETYKMVKKEASEAQYTGNGDRSADRTDCPHR